MRQHTSALLPVGHSFIPYDILLAVIRGNAEGEELTVKALFTTLPYSDMGIRYHFRTLIKSGWIELHNGDKDTRIKRVKPTEKLIKRFALLSQQLKLLFEK
jgi:DNA-binding MarR family transcriptional regulator